MTPDPLREKLWRRLEGAIDPFQDTDREVLPESAWAFILYFARQAKGPFTLLLVSGFLAGAIDAALYWSVGWLIDLLDATTPQRLFADHWPELAGLLVLILVVRAVIIIGSAIVEQQVVVPGFFSMVRWQAFRRVIEQPYDFYQNDFAGRIATKILQGGEAVGDFIVNVLQTMWAFLTFVLLSLTILVSLDPLMGAVVLAWFLGYAAIVYFLLPEMRRAGRATADQRSIFNGRLVDAFTNIMAVKLFDSGRREHVYVRDGLESYLGAVFRLTRSITTVRSAVALINGVMMTAVAAICIVSWSRGDISTGAIAAALGLVFRLNQMSGWMMFNINGLVRNYATIQDATRTISVRPAIRDAENAAVLPRASGDILFDNVSFHYGKGSGVIENLNLHIRPGERVALVGPSGAGKTTIVNLALRLFDVEQGRIMVDGRDIRDITQASLRAQFGVVSQDAMLMHRSISDNIGYGRAGASQAEIVDAARRAAAHDFIVDVADPRGRRGYDAHVGERGVKLSGGQRQRVAIARMMLKDAPILILDEATSALDSEVEAAIQDNLDRLMEGKTVIAIAHRLSTIAALDRLIVLDEGRIVEEGSHDALIAKGGLYAQLWKRQSGGFLADRLAAE
ncbi:MULTISPECIES: ABC transporter ATP-binding protein [Aminobacter]|jgi:ATP-binding cassette subfamily B multidrug efflux pump|uniref:ATP-binding cassette subfamily B protein/ATP-binding cassette subfamily B multidrug efflux pump n=1 Tax=Aminobacter ciceronei TaxID=150723 RepID=A0ABR6C082_9HYPH|nr:MULTISPECIES: ABC transporter ATP-binding protein [Aminobacter]MBA8904602.1 ATP-binding cassette subfamily B protein/ATP-binding cassette subfamily B multidrug efflux pump [Aminobacter ciceronei]MBA9018380.1 ATP-binding cassette subfamily B protein/ATP-binding cassette subfamily B multidrug efflux pump [Aminobacter ciceronei]MRX32967.1 ATP-binding cassette domain-containing protein [Aminobacter sp. MDW-2]QNH36605.1 ABC transporter ATP-binding protein [Aminobacter sp. MDW-2]